MSPVQQVQNVAGTAGAIATQAIEMATRRIPIATEVVMPTFELDSGMTGIPEVDIPDNIFDPQEKPLSSWKDIPIMPRALAGQEGEGVYSFKVAATSQEIQTFYNVELTAKGWTSTLSDPDMPFMLFSKDSQMLTITITEAQDNVIVLLTTN